MWKIVSNRDLKSLQESIDALTVDVKNAIKINLILREHNAKLTKLVKEQDILLKQMGEHINKLEREKASAIKIKGGDLYA